MIARTITDIPGSSGSVPGKGDAVLLELVVQDGIDRLKTTNVTETVYNLSASSVRSGVEVFLVNTKIIMGDKWQDAWFIVSASI